MEKLLILGSGPAGLTAGIYAARANLNPKIADGPLPGGLLVQTGSVENFPGFPDGVDGFELTGRMRCQAERAGGRIDFEYSGRRCVSFLRKQGRTRGEIRRRILAGMS